MARTEPDSLGVAIDRRFMVILTAIPIFTLWLFHLGQSFWLDETGTYWIISGTVQEAWERSLHFQVQTPLYFMFMWAVERFAHGSEVLLRLPSVLAVLAASIGVAELAERLLGRTARWIAPAVFVAVPYVAAAALDARPYAPALAAVVWSGVFLLRWLGSRRSVYLGLFVLAAAFTAAFHIAFLVVVLIQLVFGVTQCDAALRARLTIAGLVLGVLCVPSLVAAAATLGGAEELSVPFESALGSLGVALLPPSLVTAVVGALALGGRPHPRVNALQSEHGLRASYGLVLSWLVGPPAFLWALSAFTPVTIFAPRYFSMATPAVALAAAAGLVAMWDGRRRERAVIGFVAILLGGAWPAVGTAGWREATAAANEVADEAGSLLFVQSGYIESDSPEYFGDHDRRAWLLAPLSRYPVEGDAVPVPYELDEFGRAYLERESRAARAYQNVVLITLRPDTRVDLFLDPRLPGFDPGPTSCFRGVCVIEFRRENG